MGESLDCHMIKKKRECKESEKKFKNNNEVIKNCKLNEKNKKKHNDLQNNTQEIKA
jgi:hypothetical protein